MDKERWKTSCKDYWISSGDSSIWCYKYGRQRIIQTVWLV